MSLPLTEKLKRVLSFLMGVRNPRIMSIMATRGFNQTELDEGWQLFTLAAGAKLTYTGSENAAHDPSMVRQYLADLDRWENTWFPVVSATLERYFPALHQTVFQNLSQTEGPEVLISVGTLLERLQRLTDTETGQPALARLASRGFTAEVQSQAYALINQLKKSDHPALPQIESSSKAAQDQAMTDIWVWYKEWSQLARTVIQRNDMLIRLGLRQASRSGKTVDDPDMMVEAASESSGD